MIAGLVSGIVLGVYLKIIQVITNIKVYTLLLNVDYVPILKSRYLPEIIEFGLHLLISVGLACAINIYITKNDIKIETVFSFVIRLSLLVGLLLYPTTLLSERTPSITNGLAFFVWMVGHWIYGIVLAKILLSSDGGRV